MSENITYDWLSQAPANTMILGEHSVVYGHPAIACAVNQYVTIYWSKRADKGIDIRSALGNHQTHIEQISQHPKLHFVVSALQAFQSELPHGLTVDIHSEFSSTIGLGSSAAVLAAMLSGLNHICECRFSQLELFRIGHRIILDIQGRGSGTDLAASLSGGMIYFQPANQDYPIARINKLSITLPLALIYCGYKTPTAEVLKKVAIEWREHPNELKMLYRSMAKVTRSAYHALEQKQMTDFYQACHDYQQLMEQLGVSDNTLEKILKELAQCPAVLASKISGSGLGDCILAIGNLTQCPNNIKQNLKPYQQIEASISQSGAFTRINCN